MYTEGCALGFPPQVEFPPPEAVLLVSRIVHPYPEKILCIYIPGYIIGLYFIDQKTLETLMYMCTCPIYMYVYNYVHNMYNVCIQHVQLAKKQLNSN